MPRPKGLPKTGGRQKGSQNQITRDVRETIINAFYGAGGEKYLRRQATKNPMAFLALLGKVLPRDVRAEVGETLAALIEASLLRPRLPGDGAKVIEHAVVNGAAQLAAAVAESVDDDGA